MPQGSSSGLTRSIYKMNGERARTSLSTSSINFLIPHVWITSSFLVILCLSVKSSYSMPIRSPSAAAPNWGGCGSGVEPASCHLKVASSIPLVCMPKCLWVRYWTPNRSWCAGRHLAWQPPPSMYELQYVALYKCLLNVYWLKLLWCCMAVI